MFFAPFGNSAILSFYSVNSATHPYHLVNSAIFVYPVTAFSVQCVRCKSHVYRVSPIIRPTRKIRPSVIFEDDFNVSPTLEISPS